MTELALAHASPGRSDGRPEGLDRAWMVAGATGLAILAAAGAAGTCSVMILPVGHAFGWDVATVSAAFALRLAVFAVAGLCAAPLIEAFGVRRVACGGLVLIGAGLLASLAMSRVWHLMLLWGVLVGLGSGLVSLVLGTSVAARWFATRRGLAVGLFGAAATAGQTLPLPGFAAITEAFGWRAGILAACGLLGAAFLAVQACVPRHSRPEAALAGRAARSTGAPSSAPGGAALVGILFGTFVVCGATTTGLVQTHFVPLCADLGVRPVRAAGLLAGMGLLTLVGSMGAGWLADRFDGRWLLFWFYGLRGLSLLCLPLTDLSFVELSVFACVYGLDWVATVPPTARLVLDRFGPERAPRMLGRIFVGHQVGAVAAATGAGLSRVDMGSYLPAFVIAGAFCLCAAGAIPLLSGRSTAGAAQASGTPLA
jgi:MFS family permease